MDRFIGGQRSAMLISNDNLFPRNTSSRNLFFKVASRYRDEAETNVTSFEAGGTGNRPLLLHTTSLPPSRGRHMVPSQATV